MAPSRIDLAEQPVQANDLIGLKTVTQAVPITVEADEAAYSLDQVMILVRERIVDAISLKITKLGGLRKTYRRRANLRRRRRAATAWAPMSGRCCSRRTPCSLPRRCRASGTPRN